MEAGDRVIYKATYMRDPVLGDGVKDGDIGTLTKIWPNHYTVKFDKYKKSKVVNQNNLKLYKEEEKKLKRITNLPNFMPGEVIDMSYKTNMLPNRILIMQVKMSEVDNGWVYDVLLENTGDKTTMEEIFIQERMTHKSRKVYSNPYVSDLYNQGFRFCGNFSYKDAIKEAKRLKDNANIFNIQVHPGFWPDGSKASGQHGVWIRYHRIIMSNGMVCEVIKIPSEVTIIK